MSPSETSRTGNGKSTTTTKRPTRSFGPSPADAGGIGPQEVGARAMEALAPEGALGTLDPVSFGKALTKFGSEIARRPVPTLKALSKVGSGLALTGFAAAGRAVGLKTPGPTPGAAGDKRFSDPAWETNAYYFATLQGYRLFGQLIEDLLEVAELEEPWGPKAQFMLRMMVDAVSPTNYLATNPAAIKRAFDTGGVSLLRGARNVAIDMATNQGYPRKVDRSAFTVGKNLAASPGKVVFRNDLMELIQYSPTTETVHAVPVLFSPPWINKFYIMDLAPGRSFAEWAVNHGHTVFAISYRNPDKTMGGVKLDDYLLDGPITALDVISDITGSPKVNLVGLCLGGSLTAMLLAYLAAKGEDRINSATFLNTLVDFSEPGTLGTFSDPESVTRIEAKMAKRGFLESTEMSHTFDLMRGNDLVWNYVASSWLMGEDPPKFDILAWNEDGTRMPAAMHSFYLRSCYIENRLATDTMELAGTPLHLGDVKADTYVLSAKEDHIAPWTSAYKTTQLLPGNTRFTLSSSGHIAGIVNPPGPKSKHWTNDATPADPKQWLAGAKEHQGSWWEDWAGWIAERAGARGKPPAMGSAKYKAVAEAPGSYVHG